MVNYTLQSLTSLIKKFCKVVDNESATDRYTFTIDTEKLDNVLQHDNTNLHVIGMGKTLTSKKIGIEDMQLIMEYVHNPKSFNKLFDGNTNILQFLLFSTENENGAINLTTGVGEDGVENVMSAKEIYANCNTELNEAFVKNVVKDLPCYGVIVTRGFSKAHDKFEYKVNIRSNFAMVAYQKSNKEIEIIDTEEK